MKNYIYIIVPFITIVLAQLIKFTIESIRDKKLRWGRLFNGNGGMPSSHTSFTFSLVMIVGYLEGFTSPLFAVALIFSMVVAYDAMGLRMESGKHAVMLNKITEELFEGDTKEGIKQLKEELGHKPLEVLMGIVLGIITSSIIVNLLWRGENMKLKNSFFYTIREDIKDEESKSGNLLVRSGMIKKSSNGVYMYMPLGFKVLKNIEKIVRDEMDKSGCQELLMPSLINEEVYINSGRREVFGSDMFTLKDRYNRPYSLGPTHEELFVIAASMQVKSYKDLPFNIYQMATKYRDEPRPRYGLIRVREFIMKDAYSFDTDLEGLDKSYKIMYDAYKNIFDRVEIDYKIVTAATGAMGGLLSEEFQAVTDIGEDILVLCDKCDYASNIEVSKCIENKKEKESKQEKELVHTPKVGSIVDIAKFLNVKESDIVKTLIYKVDDKFYALLVPGNREINELKVTQLLNASSIELASPEDVERITRASIGFAGPIGLNIPIIIDNDILSMSNFIVGANKTDYHYKNVNLSDFEYTTSGDIKNVIEGDTCPVCGGKLYFKKGIEIGNIFKLGTKYSEKLNLYYTDKDNNLKPVQMGCYGIGLGRIMASVVEQNNDEKGIIWPINIAPYKIGIVVINTKDETQVNASNLIYDKLNNLNIDTILDDRDERPGVKFNDLDLIGIPIRITVGKKINDGIIEFKLRNSDEVQEIKMDDVISEIEKYL